MRLKSAIMLLALVALNQSGCLIPNPNLDKDAGDSESDGTGVA